MNTFTKKRAKFVLYLYLCHKYIFLNIVEIWNKSIFQFVKIIKLGFLQSAKKIKMQYNSIDNKTVNAYIYTYLTYIKTSFEIFLRNITTFK